MSKITPPPEQQEIKKNGSDKLVHIPGLTLTIIGTIIFMIGTRPELFGLDRSPAIGFIQVGVFSFGLTIMTLGGSLTLNNLWSKGERSILADIGLRLAWTGLLVCLSAGMADLFGLGTRPLTESTTFFGYWQARGVVIGEYIIMIGFLLMIPFKDPKPSPPTASE